MPDNDDNGLDQQPSASVRDQGRGYGDPELLDDGFEDVECEDSTRTLLSDILPKTGKRFAFKYEYDFGDGWAKLKDTELHRMVFIHLADDFGFVAKKAKGKTQK